MQYFKVFHITHKIMPSYAWEVLKYLNKQLNVLGKMIHGR